MLQTVSNLLVVDGRFSGIERLRSLDRSRLWKRSVADELSYMEGYQGNCIAKEWSRGEECSGKNQSRGQTKWGTGGNCSPRNCPLLGNAFRM